jgi:hypothetical protein
MRYARVQMNSPAVSRVCQFVAVVTSQMLKTLSHEEPRNRADNRARTRGKGSSCIIKRAGSCGFTSKTEQARVANRHPCDVAGSGRSSRSGKQRNSWLTPAPKAAIPGRFGPLSQPEARRRIKPETVFVYQIPDARLFTAAATSFAMQQTKRPPERPAAFELGVGSAAYSAATLRGGSSAPESWISATW